MKNNFIKVVDPEMAKFLSTLGFQYIKEQNIFAFTYSDELLAVIQKQYACPKFICENKLRF